MKANTCKLNEILRNERQQNFDRSQQALFEMNSQANGQKMGKIIESLQVENMSLKKELDSIKGAYVQARRDAVAVASPEIKPVRNSELQ